MNAVLEILRKHVLSFVCLLVAALAIGLWFYPIGYWYANARNHLDERQKVYNRLEQLKKQPRVTPIVDPANTTPERLSRFPNAAMIAHGEQVRAQMEAESRDTMAAALELNRHSLLVPKSLPAPGAKEALVFRDHYRVAATALRGRLQGTHPPSIADVEKRTKEIWATKYEPRQALVNGVPDPNRAAALKAQFDQECLRLPSQMKTERARAGKIYLTKDVFYVNAGIMNQPETPSVDAIWNAQASLWVQEDIVAGIQTANAAATSVLDAPIKQLMKIELADPFIGSGSGTAVAARGVTLLAGRAPNPLYDTCCFRLVMRVDASQISHVIQSLQKDRLLTVCTMDLSSVDAQLEFTRGFDYGSNIPVVQLTLDCEMLFMRDATVQYMPRSICTLLGISPK